MTWIVYILECADSSLYTGITSDIERRMIQHRSGTGAKYMRGREPFRLVYTEDFSNRGAALRREAEIKAMGRAAKLKLVHT